VIALSVEPRQSAPHEGGPGVLVVRPRLGEPSPGGPADHPQPASRRRKSLLSEMGRSFRSRVTIVVALPSCLTLVWSSSPGAADGRHRPGALMLQADRKARLRPNSFVVQKSQGRHRRCLLLQRVHVPPQCGIISIVTGNRGKRNGCPWLLARTGATWNRIGIEALFFSARPVSLP